MVSSRSLSAGDEMEEEASALLSGFPRTMNRCYFITGMANYDADNAARSCHSTAHAWVIRTTQSAAHAAMPRPASGRTLEAFLFSKPWQAAQERLSFWLSPFSVG